MICPAFASFITTHNKLSIEKEKNDKLFKSQYTKNAFLIAKNHIKILLGLSSLIIFTNSKNRK